jgi:DNA-binding FadR family transcriptional regulator
MVSGRTLSQAVTEAILDRIRAGEYRPGDRLATEKGLMEQFGVGRNVVREAVQALVAMGLVDVRPGRGAVVIGVDTSRAIDPGTVSALLLDQTVDDLNEFRGVLEVEIATRAAERATPADIEQLNTLLEEYRDRVERGQSLSEIELRYHGSIASASHNAVYVRVLDALHELLAQARGMTENIEWSRVRSLADHQEILAAIEAHDTVAARDAMRRHMELARESTEEARRRRAADDERAAAHPA